MTMFKLQHPQDLVSRLFMLEYMREIGATKLYGKANKHNREKFFYKYSGEVQETGEEIEEVDINWEYCLFNALIPELENFLKNYEEELKEIEEKNQKKIEKFLEKKHKADMKKPVDINLMDLAKADMSKDGLKLN